MQMQKVTLGGDRLGSGRRQQVELHGFERSTHDLSRVWRSTMAAGTLVPFMTELMLPGDTFDIDLDAQCMTHPTLGPLFGSYKVQLDVFVAPIRLYQAWMNNNMVGIGMNMNVIKLPKIDMLAQPLASSPGLPDDLDNAQINPSSLLSYLGIRGIGLTTVASTSRSFNATTILMYWDVYKNYYSNKMETEGAVIHTPSEAIVTIDEVRRFHTGTETVIAQFPSYGIYDFVLGDQIRLYYTGATLPIPSQIMLTDTTGRVMSAAEWSTNVWTPMSGGGLTWYMSPFRWTTWGNTTITGWDYINNDTINTGAPAIERFPLSNIDDMKIALINGGAAFSINTPGLEPYRWLYEQPNGIPNVLSTQEGLGLKTYNSDLLNNWLNTDWIDGTGGITEVTRIDTSAGYFNIDTLNLSKKVYQLLNRVLVSGGSYYDWIDAVWDQKGMRGAQSPIYMGGLIKELVFQEVVSNSTSENQPLGTLAGKGVMSKKHKGGQIYVKTDEPSYLMGIVSLTPILDYSQGNKWDVYLDSLDDLHKPNLDEIGFQELLTRQMHWATDYYDSIAGKWISRSAGKQPAWINYMTSLNETRGNFAIASNEMFMTLNRRYEVKANAPFNQLADMTTYIDPSKFNFIFAETALDAQNFWMQIGIGITARRKMSAKVMPNL